MIMEGYGFATPAQQLMIRMTWVHPDEGEIHIARELADKVTDWKAYYELAQHQKVVPINYENFQKAGIWDKVPKDAQALFLAERDKIQTQNEERVDRARHFLNRFIEEKLPVAILKGSAFAKSIYQDVGYKRMNDVDILIHREDSERAYDIFEELDYFPLGERIPGDRKKSDKLTHLGPAYISKDLKCVIGPQWGIKTLIGSWTVDYKGIWSRMRTFDYWGVPLKELAPEDHMHHLVLHLGIFKIALRDMMDIYNLTRFYGQGFDWELYLKIVKESGSENHSYHALSIANRLCPQLELAEACRRLEPHVSRRFRKNVKEKTKSINLIMSMFNDQVQTLELCISRFFMTDLPGEKWPAFFNLYRNIYWPPKKEFEKIMLLENAGPLKRLWARMRVPWRILWVVSTEAGMKLLILLIIKTNLDLWKCTFTYPFKKKENRKGFKDFAARLGMTVEELETLAKHFQ